MAKGAEHVIISIPEAKALELTSSQMGSSIPQSTEPVRNTDSSFNNLPQIPRTNSNSLTQRKPSTRSTSSKHHKQVEDSESDPKKEENHDIFKDIEKLENQRKGMNWKKFIVFMELIAFLIIMGLLIASLAADKLQNSTIWDLEIWKWCLILLAILCGRLISYMFTEIIMLFIWKFCLDEKVLYFAHGVRKSVVFCIWLGLVTLSWRLMFNRNAAQQKTSRVLAGFLIGSGLWLVKTVCVKLIGSLHAQKLFDKIKEAIHQRKVLRDVLEMKDKPKDTTVSKKQNVEKVSKDTMKELMDAIRGKRLLPLSYNCKICCNKKHDNDDARAGTAAGSTADSGCMDLKNLKRLWKRRLWNDEYEINSDGNDEHEINDDARARRAAEDIFNRLAAESTADSKYMDLKNLKKFLEDDKVIQHFRGVAEDKSTTAGDQQNNTHEDEDDKQIKRSVFRSWVVDIYKDHDSLNSTLKHNKTAIDELNVIASVIVMFAIVVVWFLFMGFLTIKILVFLSSQLVLAAFMFGNTVKTIFEAVIFVFVVHPFDIGDRCVIDGVQMVVDEMNIITTTFLRYDGEKIYYPNAVLSAKPISNLYRSPPMTDCLEFAISLRTKMDVIEKLQDKIKEYLESNPRRWRPEHSVQFKEIENVNKMKMAVYVNHTVNFHYFIKRAKRRSDFVLKMKCIFEELDIEYNLLPQQVNLVASATGSLPVRPWHLSPYI